MIINSHVDISAGLIHLKGVLGKLMTRGTYSVHVRRLVAGNRNSASQQATAVLIKICSEITDC